MFLVHFADNSLRSSSSHKQRNAHRHPAHFIYLFILFSFLLVFFLRFCLVVAVELSLDRVTLVIIGVELPFLVPTWPFFFFFLLCFLLLLLFVSSVVGGRNKSRVQLALMVDVVLMSWSVDSEAIKKGGRLGDWLTVCRPNQRGRSPTGDRWTNGLSLMINRVPIFIPSQVE